MLRLGAKVTCGVGESPQEGVDAANGEGVQQDYLEATCGLAAAQLSGED